MFQHSPANAPRFAARLISGGALPRRSRQTGPNHWWHRAAPQPPGGTRGDVCELCLSFTEVNYFRTQRKPFSRTLVLFLRQVAIHNQCVRHIARMRLVCLALSSLKGRGFVNRVVDQWFCWLSASG